MCHPRKRQELPSTTPQAWGVHTSCRARGKACADCGVGNLGVLHWEEGHGPWLGLKPEEGQSGFSLDHAWGPGQRPFLPGSKFEAMLRHPWDLAHWSARSPPIFPSSTCALRDQGDGATVFC